MKHNSISSFSENTNLFFYNFGPISDIYTKGNSIKFNLEIIKIDNQKLDIIYKVEENVGVFTLVVDNDNYYFTKVSYNKNKEPFEHSIVKLDFTTNNLGLIIYNDLPIYSAVIVKNQLFFSTINESQKYDIFKIDLDNEDRLVRHEKNYIIINTGYFFIWMSKYK